MNTEKARFNMIEQQIRPWEVLDPGVLELLGVVKREDFVPEALKELAFADVELPLTAQKVRGQVMLAPKIEARMLQELAIKNTDKVLEIGTGSGYMAALLAARAEFVHSVEIDAALADTARANLARAGVVNVSVVTGDGTTGLPEPAPYDVIVISGSLPEVPAALKEQLKVGGRLIAIVGEEPAMSLQLVTRSDEQAFSAVNILETVAAPLQNALRRDKFVF
jgi:protein-L-isoaspartate(D-aspartate) O-methyltransferase